MPQLTQLDHLVLTVADLDATVAFYSDVLGMEAIVFDAADGTRRHALKFGAQKINLHDAAAPFDPKALTPQPGSADLCFLTETSLQDWADHLAKTGIEIEEGPVQRSGATGPITSLYVRDPDGNLLEISNRA